MATVGEAIAASIIAQWNVGTGGTKPDPIKYVVEDSERNPNSKVADAVFVWLPLRRVFDNDIDVAEKYRNVTYTIRIECHTKTSSARQLEIENEVDRILASGTVITGATKQKVLEINDISNRSYSVGAKFVSEILMEVFTAMEESATAYGGATTAALVTDTLEFTAGGGTINRFHDEDDMASDDADGLASQQSIKAYVDKANMIGSANAAWVPLAVVGANNVSLYTAQSVYITNVGAVDFNIQYELLIPTVKGSLGLHIDSLNVGLKDADDGDYINQVLVFGLSDFETSVQIHSDPTDKKVPASVTYTIGDTDCSGYETIKVQLILVCTNALDLDITSLRLHCWYE